MCWYNLYEIPVSWPGRVGRDREGAVASAAIGCGKEIAASAVALYKGTAGQPPVYGSGDAMWRPASDVGFGLKVVILITDNIQDIIRIFGLHQTLLELFVLKHPGNARQ